MRPKLFWAVPTSVLCAILFATGCGSSSAHVRILNAIPIQTNIDMLIDSKDVASAIPYGSASAYLTASPGSRHLQIEATGSSSPFVDQNINLSSGSYDTVLDTANGVTVFTDSHSTPSSGNVSIRVINASSALSAADVYVVTSGNGLGTTPTFSNVGVPTASGYTTLAAGSYIVYFTQPGTTNVLLSTGTLSLSSGQVRTVVAMDGQTGGVTTTTLADLN
jgi:hypothetical protein